MSDSSQALSQSVSVQGTDDQTAAEAIAQLQIENEHLRQQLTAAQEAYSALARSHATVQTLLANASDCICQFTLDGKLLYMSPGGLRLNGLEHMGQVQGNHYLSGILPADKPRMQAAMERACRGKSTRLSYASLTAKGQILYWDSIVNTIHDDAGHVIGVLRASRNINQQKQVEDDYRRREDQFCSLLANLPGAVYHYTCEPEWTITFMSDAIADLSGQDAAHWIGAAVEDWLPWIHPGDRRMVQSVFAERLTTSEPYAIEYRVIHADQSIRWIYEKGQPVINSDGRVVALDGVMFDITERRQAEEALRKNEATTRALLSAIPDLMIRMTGEGIYLDFIPAADVNVIMPDATMTGLSLYDVLPPDLIPERMHYVQQALQTGATQVYEYALTIDGVVLYEEARIAVSGDDEVVVIVRDITARKQAEQALQEAKANLEARVRERTAELQAQTARLRETLQHLQTTQTQLIQTEKMSSLGQLVAGVAHEINNPVNFIHGNLAHACRYAEDLLHLLQLYREHYPTPVTAVQTEIDAVDLDFLVMDMPKLMASMRTGTERIRQIVLSLRTFSRLDEAEFKAVDIHEGLDSTLLILQHRLKATAAQRSITIVKDYGPLPAVECYAGQLNQVFMNLLSNAIDALEAWKGHQAAAPQICISTSLVTSTHVVIRIADNGPGIPPAVQQRIFDPFFTTKPVGQGTGLGLSISHQIIVERHEGQLTCQSAPGEGTEFCITIPVRQTVNRSSVAEV